MCCFLFLDHLSFLNYLTTSVYHSTFMSVTIRIKFVLLCLLECEYMSSRSSTEMGDGLANEADLLLMIKEVGLYSTNERSVGSSLSGLLTQCAAVC